MESVKKGCGCLAIGVVGFLLLILLSPQHKPSAEEYRQGVHCLGGFDGAFPPLRDAVEASLRDPDSFELVDTTITPLNAEKTHTVEMTYRARNGFGGLNTESVRACVGADCELIEILDRS
jgi:hypothetical protein